MLAGSRRPDRRSEVRHCRAGRITWRRQADLGELGGWLSDAARSSISFVAGAEVRPVVGERIEIRDAAGRTRRGRVARTAPYGPRLALVAARMR